MVRLFSIIICVVLSEVHVRATTVHPETVVSRSSVIFLAEIEGADPGPGCTAFRRQQIPSACDTKIKVRILRVFKGDSPQTVGDEFDTQVAQVRPFWGGPSPWRDIDIESGQRYLIFSAGKGTPREILRKTIGPVLVSDDEDLIGDLELILNSASLTIFEQAGAVIRCLDNRSKRHSYLLANHIASLLALGSNAETEELVRHVTESAEEVFSEAAKVPLLASLWELSKNAKDPAINLLRAYVAITARILVTARMDQMEQPSLTNHLFTVDMPWILSSQRATATLKTDLPRTVRDGVLKVASTVMANEEISANRREVMQRVVSAMSQQ